MQDLCQRLVFPCIIGLHESFMEHSSQLVEAESAGLSGLQPVPMINGSKKTEARACTAGTDGKAGGANGRWGRFGWWWQVARWNEA